MGLLLALGAANLRAQEAPADETKTNTYESPRAVQPPPSVAAIATAPADPRDRIRRRDEPLLSFGALVDHRRPVNGDFRYLTEVMLMGEVDVSKYNSVEVMIGGGTFEQERGSVADLTINDSRVAEIGVATKQYFAPSHAFLRPYLTAGVGGLLVNWEYQSPSPRPSGRKRDSMTGFNGYVGAGLYAGLREHGRVFAELDAGAMAFEGTTDRGIKNTAFDNFTYLGAKAGFALSF